MSRSRICRAQHGHSFVQIAAGCTACADRADSFITDLDDYTATSQDQMRKLRDQGSEPRDGLARSMRALVRLERCGRVSLVVGAVERVAAGAVAAQDGSAHAVSIDDHRSLGIALLTAARHDLTRPCSLSSMTGGEW